MTKFTELSIGVSDTVRAAFLQVHAHPPTGRVVCGELLEDLWPLLTQIRDLLMVQQGGSFEDQIARMSELEESLVASTILRTGGEIPHDSAVVYLQADERYCIIRHKWEEGFQYILSPFSLRPGGVSIHLLHPRVALTREDDVLRVAHSMIRGDFEPPQEDKDNG